MTAIADKLLSISTSQLFIGDLANSSYYIAIARPESWGTNNDLLFANTPIDQITDQIGFWRDMFAGIKITISNSCPVVPRINWQSGQSYASYQSSDGASLWGRNFYVLNSSNAIYKCLSNANNSISLVMPTYTATNTTHLETDGYIWKFMGIINTNDQNIFLNSSWMPVRTLSGDDGSLQWQVQQAAIDGSISEIQVLANGVNYSANSYISITGDGGNANAIPVFDVNSGVSSVIITNPGQGFHIALAQVIDPQNNGSGAILEPIISPFGGHGKDMIAELGGSNIMISTSIAANDTSAFSSALYRQFGFLKNPLVFGSTNNQISTATSFSQSLAVIVAPGNGNYIPSEVVFQGPSANNAIFSGEILSWDSGNNTLQLVETEGVISTSALIGANSGTSRFVIGTTPPALIEYSGKLLLLNNFPPIRKNPGQSETLQFVLGF